MASFDITNKPDLQMVDNALNVAKKEILNRFDFRDSKSEISLDKKNNTISILTEDTMRLESIVDAIRMRMVKQKLDPRCLDDAKEHIGSGAMIKKEIKIKTGIDRDTARKILADIKESKLKVTAQIMDDIIRVTGKKIDDLQAVIALVRKKDYELPLEFINMKS